MMVRRAILLFAAIPGLHAQLVLFTSGGTHIGSAYDLGQVAANTSEDFAFLASNPAQSSVAINNIAIAGAGFSVTSPQSLPLQVPPGKVQEITVHFAGGAPASYSANLQINNLSVLLVVTSVLVPKLTAVSGCAGPDLNGVVAFGQVQVGHSASCTFSLQNLNQQAVTVRSLIVSGSGFGISSPIHTPLTLAPAETAAFSIAFAPAAASTGAGSLTIDPQVFALTGTAVNALPTPILEFDPGAPASGQNRAISMRLPSASPLAASGSVNLSFQPSSNFSADPSVVFTANNARSIRFAIHTGDQAIDLPGSGVFQTGTTAGTITFAVTLDAGLTMAGDPTVKMVIPPAPVSIDKASAVARSGGLDVQVFSGFDNTYSTGKMSFTFYDVNGNIVQPAPVQADFTSNFNAYFTSLGGGSDFQMLVSFPVSGQANRVASVDFTMTNSAGTTPTQHLNFINDTGQCIAVGVSEILCPQTPPP